MSEKGIIYNIQRMSVQDGPGLRTTVFLKGCPLRCIWCSNPESQLLTPQLMFFQNLCVACGLCIQACPQHAISMEQQKVTRDALRCTQCGACAAVCPSAASCMSGKEYSATDVMHIIRKDASFYSNSGGGVTFGGGECTMQRHFLLKLVDACLQEGLHICLDTCGHCSANFFEELIEKVDLFLFDIKHMDCVLHKKFVGIDNTLIQQNLIKLLSLAPEKVHIRIPLMQKINDTEENIAAVACLLKKYDIFQVDILPCHTFGSSKYTALGLQQPHLEEYTPQQLENTLKCFTKHGLQTEIII